MISHHEQGTNSNTTNIKHHVENLSYSRTYTKDGTQSKGGLRHVSHLKVFDSRKPPTTRRTREEEAAAGITVSGFAPFGK